MTEDRAHKVADEPAAAGRQRPERKKRKWDQPAEDLVSAAVKAAAVAGMPVMNFGALPGVALPGVTAYGAATLPSVVPVPYSLPPHIAPLVLQNAAVAVQKSSQAKIPDEVIAREIVINDAYPSVRYKLTKRQTQEEIQRCTNTVIITRGKYHPPNEHPDGEKPLYLHISAGSQLKDTAERIKAVDHAASMIELKDTAERIKTVDHAASMIELKDTAERIKAVDRAASMIEEILKQGTISESISVPFSSSGGQGVRPFSVSIFLGFDADPSLHIAARIRGPNDQYINHIMRETGVTVILRGEGSENLGSCHDEASQQPLHLYLASMHLKNLEAAKVLAENLLDTIAAEFGASRISSSNVYGAVPPPQQLLAGTDTSGARSDVHYTLGPNVLSGAPHSFASTAVIAPVVAPAVAVQSGAPTYSGFPPPSNMAYPIPPVNGGAFYNGYGDIYPQATPLQQVAFTLKHASSSAAQAVPVTSTPTSMATKENSTLDVEMDKCSRRKFQELPVSKGPTESQNSQQGSKFVKTGLDSLGNIGSSSIAPPKKVHPGSNGMLPPEEADMSSHLSISTKMPPPPLKSMPPPPPKNMPPSPPPPKSMPLPLPPKNMLPPPSKSMPPPPPKFPLDELLSRKENKTFALKELTAPPRPLDARSVLPSQRQPKEPEEQTKGTPVSDTLLKLIDYGDDDDDDDIDVTDNIPKGNPTPGSEQKPFWAV